MTITPTTSDDELLRRMRAGEAQAFAALYRRHQGPLYRFALLRCGSPDTAADTVQEAFMGLLSGRLAFDPLRGSLPNFLFGVVRLLILKHEAPRRRESPLPEADDDAPALCCDDACPLTRVLADEAAEDVRRALARLAPHYRDAVILYEMHDLSYGEIATICAVDIGTVRSRLSRGRAALAKFLRTHALDAN
ncbi:MULTISPECIES: RNA polymerase sigma factor [unclassified Massilia]|uniref:RNA polymerase sigma factor n=1 Tax=unclassified Massilia TaxID=2609279 RepID=UPI00177CB09A|nr:MULTISPECIES: RNA polymerase sigma factor [unclassified Massilia]MBD8529636.1 RNA polymerase sigma factor [Massilia sp. CFBP 13647]MBD8673277.1 RNA polymerase sigma factor [Massilia sp. CFBP 13721]